MGRQRPAARLVADGVARAHGRHDDVVGRRRAAARAHLADARAQRLGGQHLALEAQPVAVDLGLAQHARALLHARQRRVGGAADARQLGVGLAAPALDEELVVGRQLDALGAQAIGDRERERRAGRRPR